MDLFMDDMLGANLGTTIQLKTLGNVKNLKFIKILSFCKKLIAYGLPQTSYKRLR